MIQQFRSVWPSGAISFALSDLNDLAAQLRYLLLKFQCLCICSSTWFCRNLCLPRRPSDDSLKNCLFQRGRSVHVYSLYGNEMELWGKVYILLYNVCFVWLLVFFPFLFCNFPSQSVTVMLPYFIPSKSDAVCSNFTSTYNWPTLNLRLNPSQQSRWCTFVSVNLPLLMLHHSLQYNWFVTIPKW